MLVITRRPGQSLSINEEIRIKVVRVSRGRVRLGIAAPKQYRIRRDERLNGGRPAGRRRYSRSCVQGAVNRGQNGP